MHIPDINLDPRNTRHSFSLQVINPYDRYKKQLIYFCDVLNANFEKCEDELTEELKVLSVYSFQDTPLNIKLASGQSVSDWLTQITGINMEVHISNNKSNFTDNLSWNSQIFGSCDTSQCKIH